MCSMLTCIYVYTDPSSSPPSASRSPHNNNNNNNNNSNSHNNNKQNNTNNNNTLMIVDRPSGPSSLRSLTAPPRPRPLIISSYVLIWPYSAKCLYA